MIPWSATVGTAWFATTFSTMPFASTRRWVRSANRAPSTAAPPPGTAFATAGTDRAASSTAPPAPGRLALGAEDDEGLGEEDALDFGGASFVTGTNQPTVA